MSMEYKPVSWPNYLLQFTVLIFCQLSLFVTIKSVSEMIQIQRQEIHIRNCRNHVWNFNELYGGMFSLLFPPITHKKSRP